MVSSPGDPVTMVTFLFRLRTDHKSLAKITLYNTLSQAWQSPLHSLSESSTHFSLFKEVIAWSPWARHTVLSSSSCTESRLWTGYRYLTHALNNTNNNNNHLPDPFQREALSQPTHQHQGRCWCPTIAEGQTRGRRAQY